jgi:predicted metal-dependent enzyme (double-stranded beta helix superfamily)
MTDTAPAILGRAELRRIVAGLAAAPEGWSHLVRHDPTQRVFECLRLDDQIEIWLICWMPGQDTGFHDHDLSSGAVVVAQGAVVEERLRLGGPPSLRRYVPGDVFDFSPVDIHRVTHAGTTPATTVHAYSPPLRRMGAYLIQPGGTLERHPLAKDQELRPLTSAA